MSEVVNLRHVRKQKKRQEEAKGAAANRLHFGRSLEQRRGEALAEERSRRVLDGAKLQPRNDPGKP